MVNINKLNKENHLISATLPPTNNSSRFIPYLRYESVHFQNIALKAKLTLNATVHFVSLNISYSPQIISASNDHLAVIRAKLR